MEQSFRQAMTISSANPKVFLQSGISITLLSAAVLSMARADRDGENEESARAAGSPVMAADGRRSARHEPVVIDIVLCSGRRHRSGSDRCRATRGRCRGRRGALDRGPGRARGRRESPERRCRRRRSRRSAGTRSRSRGRPPRRSAAAIASCSTARAATARRAPIRASPWPCARNSGFSSTSARCRNYPGIPSRYRDVDLVIFRENSEDLYLGIERMRDADTAEATKIITRGATERVARFAVDYMQRTGRRRVVDHPQEQHPQADRRAVPRGGAQRRWSRRRASRSGSGWSMRPAWTW